MDQTNQADPEKSISDELAAVLAQLSTDQIRFVVSRQEFGTDKEAAQAVGLKPDTVYHWPGMVREAVRLMAADGIAVAIELRRRNLPKAMMAKVAGLECDDERIRQGVATEIIEWELGKATQRQETDITTGGQAVKTLSDDGFHRAISTLADAVRESLPREATGTDRSVDTAE